MDLIQQAKIDNQIMSIAKVAEVSHVIRLTDKGPLTLKLIKGGISQDYKVVLDAVPLEDDKSKEIINILNGNGTN